MPKKKDIIGMTFGRLTVIGGPESRLSGGVKRTFWLCRCECGAEVWVRGSRLTGGHTKSCGCWSRDYHREMMRDALKIAHSKGKEVEEWIREN